MARLADDALDFLRDDHKKIKGLLRQLEAARSRAVEMSAGVFRQLCMELEIHADVEQRFVYGPLLAGQDDELRALGEDGVRAHGEIQALLESLRGTGVESENFETGFAELAQVVEEHFDDEESALFARLTGRFEQTVESAMRQRRVELSRRPEYAEALPESVQNPHGGEQKRKPAA